MYEELLKTVKNFGSPNVLVVGDFMLDVYIYGDALKISPEAPVPVLKVCRRGCSCGGAGSVAANIAAMGAKPVCIGVIGNDQNGKILTNELTKIGADISGLFTAADRPTIRKQRIVGLAQHRHQQQLMRIDEESTEPLSDEQYEKILQAYKEKLKQADIVCLQDYNKGLLNSWLCKQMIELAGKANKKVLVDPSLTSDYSKYSGATLITPNRKEASGAVGFEIKTKGDAAKAAAELRNKLNLDAAIITLDKEGAYLQTEDESEIILTRPRSIYDVTGAGDMVLATLAISLAGGCDYKTAVKLSNVTAGIEVEKFGAVSITVEEIVNELMSASNVKSINSLLVELDRHRKQGELIVFTNGCFDVIHRGHIEFLKFCKSHGDILVVGLNSDSSVKTIKGPDRPINNQHDRGAVLAAMDTVDYITIFDEPEPLDIIKKIKPDILVKGQDWADKGVVGQEFVESYGGKVILAPLIEGKSTTATIEKIKTSERKS